MILLGNGRREDGRDSRIHCVPAFFEDAETRFDFEIVSRADHLSGAADRRKHGMRVLGGHWKDYDREG